ncbi:uncharacterized protein NPIL_52031 [Nephila pilipes]|uniref:Uncharacterized protein n=1 Tax=Nephila pilipes TaxID=299642 RepID=A0A8X6QFR2_NEPPI|nr:uncharacterized protein NPIL_52031 [Nephila pilipes]
MSANKLEAFENLRRFLPSGPRRHVKVSEILNDGNQVTSRKPEHLPKREHSHVVPNERSPFKCYGCGRSRVIKSRCPTCNPDFSQRIDVAANHVNAYAAETRRNPRLTPIDIVIYHDVLLDIFSAMDEVSNTFPNGYLWVGLSQKYQQIFFTSTTRPVELRKTVPSRVRLPFTFGRMMNLIGTDLLSISTITWVVNTSLVVC